MTVANVRYQAFGDEDFDWANADAAVEGALTGVPTDTIVSQGLTTVRFGDTDGPSVPLFFRDGAADHLRSRRGAHRAGEIALPSNTPQTAGLQVGDPVTIVGPSGETVDVDGQRDVRLARPRAIRSGSAHAARSRGPDCHQIPRRCSWTARPTSRPPRRWG